MSEGYWVGKSSSPASLLDATFPEMAELAGTLLLWSSDLAGSLQLLDSDSERPSRSSLCAAQSLMLQRRFGSSLANSSAVVGAV
ncbi:hypothetical protein VNO77_02534 [Canavalia gladiata]|uniref:Uncharacterized protein n=1 Tax=Canavalia gladiata TaxID=3824 RepID=A0AAN9MYF4_CANGL